MPDNETITDVSAYWRRPDLLHRQAEMAIDELTRWRTLDVYTVFVDVGRRMVAADRVTLIDWGAGAGQYGLLWLGECGGEQYIGNNASYYTSTDSGRCVRLLSASLEYAQDPHGELRCFAQELQCALILHRLRFQTGKACKVLERSYCGADVPMWRWNRDELSELLTGRNVERIVWPHNPTQETWVIT